MVPKQWRQKTLGRRQKTPVCREMYSFPQACSWHTLDGRTVDGVHKGKGPRPVDPDAGAGAFEPTESTSQTTASLIFSAVLCCVCACIPSPPCSLCCCCALYAACRLALMAIAWYGLLELIHAAVCVLATPSTATPLGDL